MKSIVLLLAFALLGIAPAGALTLTSAKPNSGTKGTTVKVKVYGKNFWYRENIKLQCHSTGKIIYPSSTTMYAPDSLVFTWSISAKADTGYYSIIATDTNSSDTLKNGFRVLGPKKATPKITSISPTHAKQGQTVTVTISGSNTDFTGASSCTIGSLSGSAVNTGSWTKTSAQFQFTIPSSYGAVQYTLSIYDSIDGTLTYDTFTVDTTITTRSLKGAVKTSGGKAVRNSWVYLIYLDARDSTIHALDSTQTDSLGNYTFNSVSDTNVYVYCMPDSSSYPHEIPTYFDSASQFLSATPVHLNIGSNTVDITTLHGSNPGGSGFISGSVAYCSLCKKGGPVANLKIILVDANGVTQGVTFTDAKGNFSFKNISLQKYSFYVDLTKVDNSAAPSITLTSAVSSQSKLKLILYSNDLALDKTSVTTGISMEGNEQFQATLYPNPFNDNIRLDYVLANAANVSINVIDATGREVFSVNEGRQLSGNHSKTINELSTMATGLYMVQIHVDGLLIQKKVLKY